MVDLRFMGWIWVFVKLTTALAVRPKDNHLRYAGIGLFFYEDQFPSF